MYKEDGAVWKRSSRTTLSEQRTGDASPRHTGDAPRRRPKRPRWQRYLLPVALQGLVAICGGGLAGCGSLASGQDGVPRVAQPEAEANAPGPMSPQPEMMVADTPQEAGSYDDALPADCGLGCSPSWYVQGEALHFANEGRDSASLSTAYALPAPSFETGLRVTVGRRWDCAEALEVSYVGPFEWSVSGTASGFPLYSDFFVPNGDVNISAFNQAESHYQSYTTKFHSVEINERYFDWDTMSCMIGLRYMDLGEEFVFGSQRPTPPGDQGLFTLGTDNRLIGPQCGLDVIHPIGASDRLSIMARTKLGVYANFADGDVRLVNAGVQELNNSDDEVALAFQGELGVRANLRITRRLSAYCGYEVWYLYGLALVDGQALAPLTRTTGTSLDTEGDTWFHGVTLGGQFNW